MLLDMVMSKMTGPEVATLACRRHADLRVIFMTGAADAEALAGELGPIIDKPFRGAALIAAIDRLLDRRDASVGVTGGR
jgi:FixJ family two-component response regulator